METEDEHDGGGLRWSAGMSELRPFTPGLVVVETWGYLPSIRVSAAPTVDVPPLVQFSTSPCQGSASCEMGEEFRGILEGLSYRQTAPAVGDASLGQSEAFERHAGIDAV